MKGWVAGKKYADQFGRIRESEWKGVSATEDTVVVPQPRLRVNSRSDRPWEWYLPELSEMYARGEPTDDGKMFGIEVLMQGDRYLGDPWMDGLGDIVDDVAVSHDMEFLKDNRARFTAEIPLPKREKARNAIIDCLNLIERHMTERPATDDEMRTIMSFYKTRKKREEAGDVIGDLVIWDTPELYEPVENRYSRRDGVFSVEVDGVWIEMSVDRYYTLRNRAWVLTGDKTITQDIIADYDRYD